MKENEKQDFKYIQKLIHDLRINKMPKQTSRWSWSVKENEGKEQNRIT